MNSIVIFREERVPRSGTKRYHRESRFASGLLVSFGMLLLASGVQVPAAETDGPPNVVLILADDLGWSDLGCYGGDLVETPNIDRLAESGVRFTNAYAMCVCSPSRAALMTGKHAARVQMTIWSEGSLRGPQNRKLLQARSRHDLPLEEVTLAEVFHAQGYLTASIGKWHLGDADHFPEAQGFDVNIGGNHWGAPQTFWWPYRGDERYGGQFRYVPHTEFGEPGEFLTDRLTDEALGVIDQANATDQPFFLYLSFYAPHTPIEAKPADIAHFEQKLSPGLHHQHAVYAAMIKNLDRNVGRLLGHLEEAGNAQDTILLFASDNGGYIGTDRNQSIPVTNNHPLRSGKGSLYEGGIRIPFIVHTPELSQPEAVCDEPITLMDVFPTLLSLAGVTREDSAVQDGIDITPLLENPQATLPRDTLFFHYPHYYSTTTPASAIRAGDWKLLEYFEDNRLELYNLKDDFSESHNLAERNPDIAKRLQAQLHAWRNDVSAQLPRPNPDYSPSKR